MKAIEAAEHSDILLETKTQMIVSKEGDNWFDDSGVVDISKLNSDNYVPIVPKKIYKIGDQVTFPEALNSRMCFRLRNESPVQKFDGKLMLFNRLKKEWAFDDIVHVNSMAGDIFTIVDDPSVPPKPTLESLPAWTRCKVRPVNYNYNDSWDVVKKPSGSLMHYCNGNDFEWVNVKLISIYNPKTEQWECV